MKNVRKIIGLFLKFMFIMSIIFAWISASYVGMSLWCHFNNKAQSLEHLPSFMILFLIAGFIYNWITNGWYKENEK